MSKKKFYVHPQGREATSQAGARETARNQESRRVL